MLTISLQPKQKTLKNAIEFGNFEWIGYGGARGGAKSHAVRSLAIFFGWKYKIQSLIFRRYRDDLLKNHVYPLLRAYPSLRDYFNKTELTFYHPETRSPILKFDYTEREEDIEKVGQGTEYQLVFIDEATQSTQGMIEYLSTCCRDPYGLFPSPAKVICTMNPGGVGHAYIKRVFVDRIFHDYEKPESYYFIQAHVWDNIFWALGALKRDGFTAEDYYGWPEEKRIEYTLGADAPYVRRLKALPYDLMMANLYGDWEIFGGSFFPDFSRKLEIEPFEIPVDWKLVSSIDPGWSSPCSYGVHAMDYERNFYRLFTYYEAGRSPGENAEAIFQQHNNFTPLQGRKPSQVISGHDAFAKKDRYAILAHELTFADILKSVWDEHKWFPSIQRGSTDRKQRWFAWKQLQRDGQWMYFKDYNTPLVTEATAVLQDKNDPDDIQGKGRDPEVSDHALDECGMGILSQWIPRKAEEVPEVNREFRPPQRGPKPRDRREFWK